MVLISIIMPVYNASKTLARAVDSILNQKEKNFELILINDGSSDNSLQICNEYSNTDSRVKVIHQENKGVSIARNIGIDASSGKYLGFVDSDDWIDSNMYYDLINIAEEQNADIVMCDATTVYDSGKTQLDTISLLQHDSSISKTDLNPQLLLELAGSAWRCLYTYRHSDNEKHDAYAFHFPLGIKFSEDRIFNLYNFAYANKIYYKKASYYNRYVNKKSTVHRFHRDYFETIKKSHNETMKAIEIAWNNDNKLKNAYNIHFINGAFMAICNYYYSTSTMSWKERLEAIKIICNDNELIEAINSYGNNYKTNLILCKKYIYLIIYAILSNIKNRIR